MILAAGAATRMGVPKLVLPFGSTTMIGAVVGAANAADVEPVVVVSGFHDAAVLEAVGHAAPVVHNPRAATGNLSSLLVGLDAVGNADGVVILLADMPRVSASLINDLADGLLASGCVAGWVGYTDGRGHPIALAASAFDDVRTLEGRRPLWDFVDGLGDDEAFVLPVDDSKPIDVNTPEEYERATRQVQEEKRLRN